MSLKKLCKKSFYKSFICILILTFSNLSMAFFILPTFNKSSMNRFIFNTDNNLNAFSNFSQKSKFIYILQGADFKTLYNESFDIAVVDCDDSKLTKDEILLLKGQNKVILSYLSIGEAESYREYWQKNWKVGNPEFIDEENICWPGNYKVKFWYSSWQEIIFKKLNQIINLGYDGVYLDVIDSYEYYKEKGNLLAEYYMVKFVIKISKTAKSKNPNFLVVPQNAENLVKYRQYLLAIDGLGRENLWFEENTRISHNDMSGILKNLIYTKNNNKFIFAINYTTEKSKIAEFLILCRIYGFIPYVGPKNLDCIYRL